MAEETTEPFSVRIEVRGYETDALGHVNASVYGQYAEHARWKLFEKAGIRQRDLLAARIGPVVLELHFSYRNELRAEDEVDVDCVVEWGEGRTMTTRQTLRRADGTVAAEVTGTAVVVDLDRRKAVADPRAALRELAAHPGLLGL
ncbi:acyl-CoA thioesterase [Streptomyces sp. HNM0574]|uniref:acyl-CoA thioesterase n=1 Tax=Streptomyces sp. HNM0574 TaxID=2714954 RepID=UPI00146DF145|nr:acyl-CoA thioesterase [Streptomyces sp. HNM0574]NLU66707.1 acyl-CoA thioesterase [Streptomyces sp. HNM0574]